MKHSDYIGKEMIFTGADDIQATWTGNADPREFFHEGQVVTVRDIHISGWSSTIEVDGYPEKMFNSVCFSFPFELTT
jgi:hypothetical protein